MGIDEILLAGTFFTGAILIQILGILISDWANHKKNLERIKIEHENKKDYARKEIFLKRKLEKYEDISEKMTNLSLSLFEFIIELQDPKKTITLKNLSNKIHRQQMQLIMEDKMKNMLYDGADPKIMLKLQEFTSIITNTMEEIANLISNNKKMDEKAVKKLKLKFIEKISSKQVEITSIMKKNLYIFKDE